MVEGEGSNLTSSLTPPPPKEPNEAVEGGGCKQADRPILGEVPGEKHGIAVLSCGDYFPVAGDAFITILTYCMHNYYYKVGHPCKHMIVYK